MRKYIKVVCLVIVAAVLSLSQSNAQGVPAQMKPARLVNDYVGILTPDQNRQIESELVSFSNQTSTQIVVAIVPDLGGMDISTFAIDLGHKWGVGQADKDNGIVIVVKPKMSRNDRGQAFISVGYGLEGAVPDATAKMIIENDMIPYFAKGQIYEGIYHSINTLRSLVAGEYTSDEYKEKESRGNYSGLWITGAILLMILLGGLTGKNKSVDMSSGGSVNSSSLLAMLLLFGVGRGSGGGGFGGGGFGGSSGGGGFGGFGGGDFGGGGAGGSW